MVGEVIHFRRAGYKARQFWVEMPAGRFSISGTLCGHIDMACPGGPTFPLSPDEVAALIVALTGARHDVLANSRPFDDPCLQERDSHD